MSCEACGQNEPVGVCNCLLQQPVSLAYCKRCLREGIEAWWLIVATVGVCCWPPPEGRSWREALAPWALEIIDRSMTFHGKTETDLLTELQAA